MIWNRRGKAVAPNSFWAVAHRALIAFGVISVQAQHAVRHRGRPAHVRFVLQLAIGAGDPRRLVSERLQEDRPVAGRLQALQAQRPRTTGGLRAGPGPPARGGSGDVGGRPGGGRNVRNLLQQPGRLFANAGVARLQQPQQGGNRRLRQAVEQGPRSGQAHGFLFVAEERFQLARGRVSGGQFQGGDRRPSNCRPRVADRLPQPRRIVPADTGPEGLADRLLKRIGHDGQDIQEQRRRLRRGRLPQPIQGRRQQVLRLALPAIGQQPAGAKDHFHVVALHCFAERRLGQNSQTGQLPGSGLANA